MASEIPKHVPTETTEPLDVLLEAGRDRDVVERLMSSEGNAVLARCRAALGGDTADPGVVWDARHETFVEAFKDLGPRKALPDPTGFMAGWADRVCASVLKAERNRVLPREPFVPPEGDWRGPVRWELDVLGEEAPEKYTGRRSRAQDAPSPWRGAALAGFAALMLVISGVMRC